MPRSAASTARPGAVTALRPVIVLLGDSITETASLEGGWGQLLSKDYIRKADIINRGYGGYNSRQVCRARGA